MEFGLDQPTIKQKIREKAAEIGFCETGFAPAATTPEQRENLTRYIAECRHGGMEWMPDTQERRSSPTALWQDVKSVIVLGTNYGPDFDPLAVTQQKDRAAISCYAKGKDYHDPVKKKLKRLARWMVEEFGCELKVFVDTAPVMEKPLAAASGLGWQGKHTNLISRRFGSWLFLGEIYTTLNLEPDRPEADHCGSCTACIDACPTNAITAPYQINGSACISYLTIEHKGPIDEKFREGMGNWIYGCDECLAVCPWTKFTQPTEEEIYQPRPQTMSPELSDIIALDDLSFREMFQGSPIKRSGRNRIVRNALIAIGNSGDAGLKDAAAKLLDDEDDAVREAAAWAVNKLDR